MNKTNQSNKKHCHKCLLVEYINSETLLIKNVTNVRDKTEQ